MKIGQFLILIAVVFIVIAGVVITVEKNNIHKYYKKTDKELLDSLKIEWYKKQLK